MILGDKPLISEVDLSHKLTVLWTGFTAWVHVVYGSSLNDDHPSTDWWPGSNLANRYNMT
jgi:hypothetical protein